MTTQIPARSIYDLLLGCPGIAWKEGKGLTQSIDWNTVSLEQSTFDSRQPSRQIWLKDFGRSVAAFSLDGATDRRTDTDTNLYFHSSSPLTTTTLPGAILHQDEQETRLTMANSTDRTRAPPHQILQSRSNSEPMSQNPTPNMELSGQLGNRGKR